MSNDSSKRAPGIRLRTHRSAGSLVGLLTIGIASLALGWMTSGCAAKPAFEQLAEARQLAADLIVHFTRATDAANRAVMADTDEASVAFAREAEQASQDVQQDTNTLRPILKDLGYLEESRLLEEFDRRFGEYRALDRKILALAVENTNLKAQRLSFGAAQESAEAFKAALEAVVPSRTSPHYWQIKAIAASAVTNVRELQVLQAPHIAEADDAVMTHLEQRMTTAEAGVRDALRELANATPQESRPRIAAAVAAFDMFMKVNAEIVALSRRNTNVRSLALTLNDKGKLTNACNEDLRALREALGKHTLGGTR
jgi:hypothetical protein